MNIPRLTIGWMALAVTCAIIAIDTSFFSQFRSQFSVAKTYRQTPGTIVESTIKIIPATRNRKRAARPVIRYSYTVDEVATFESNRYRYLPDCLSAQEMVKRYPAGAPVQVLYNPKDMSDAVLSGTVLKEDWRDFWILVSFNFVLGMIWAVVIFWPRKIASLIQSKSPKNGSTQSP
jgi:hypothetical protein